MLVLSVVAAALGVLCGYLAASTMRRVGLRAQTTRARRMLGAPRSTIDEIRPGDEVTLEGVLCLAGQRELVTSSAPGSWHLRRPALDAVTFVADVAIDVRGERVRLEQWVEVLVGSREDRATRSRTVRPADRVRVRGTFARSAEIASSYRHRAASAALIPTRGATGRVKPVVVVFDGAPRPRGVPWRAFAASTVASTALCAIAGWAARDELLHVVDQANGIPCAQRAEALLDAARPWEAAPIADRCGDPLLEARARWLVGDFGAASRAWKVARAGYQVPAPATRSEIEAHLIAGDRDEAARLLRARARASDTPVDRVADLVMLAEAVEARGRLAPRVLERFAMWGPAAAAPLWKAAPGEALFVDDLHWTVDGRFDLQWTARWPVAIEWARLRDLQTSSVAGPLSESRVLASYAVRLGLYHAYLGEHADAMRIVPPRIAALTEALTSVANGAEWSPVGAHPASTIDDEAIYDGAAMLALDLGAVALARAYFGQRRWLGGNPRSADDAVADDLELAETNSRMALAALWSGTHLNPLFAVAAHGRGEPLATLLGPGTDAYLVLPRAVPAIVTGREALVRWTEARPPPCWTCGVEAVVADVAVRRQAARALQMYELERAQGDIARKLLAVKLDETLGPLLFGLEQVL